MKLVRFKYKGDLWNAYIIPDEESSEFFEDTETAAEVQFDKKEIYFTNKEIDLSVILHELFHMARGYQYVQDSELNFHQSEELFCNIFAYDGQYLLKLGLELDKMLNRLRRAKVDELTLEINGE